LGSSFTKTAMSEVANNAAFSIAKGTSLKDGEQLSKDAAEALSRQDTYSEQSALSRASETKHTLDGAQAATKVVENKAAMTLLEQAVSRHRLGGAVDSFLRTNPYLKESFRGDIDKAWAYAALATLDGKNVHGNGYTRDPFDVEAGEHLPPPGAIQNKVEPAVTGRNLPNVEDFKNQARETSQRLLGNSTRTDDSMRGRFVRNTEENEAQFKEWANPLRGEIYEHAGNVRSKTITG